MGQVAEKMGMAEPFFEGIEGFRIDSRQVEKGDLFFALEGERVDGHAFLEEVARRGAAGAVVRAGYGGPSFGLPLFYSEDVLASLHALARESMQNKCVKVVGITGSVGKTTTKEFLATLLEKKFRMSQSPLSYNSQRTFPLGILNRKGDEELLVLEMAMSEPGEIARLVDIAPPDIAVITKIGRSHTAFFPDGMEGVAAAKGEILGHPKTQLGIVHEEAMGFYGIGPRGRCKKVTFGRGNANFCLKEDKGELIVWENGRASPCFTLPLAAGHLVDNFLAAAAVARELGMSWDEIIERAQKIKPVSKRFEVLDMDGVTFVNDCYNASAESTLAALRNLPIPKAGGKRIFVFGEMRELGSLSKKSHEEVGEAACNTVDHLICLGSLCQPILEKFSQTKKKGELCQTFEELEERLQRVIKKGDVVLIKGANSHKLWRLVENG